MTTTSYCVVCDAEPGRCAHNGARYLPDITYEPVEPGEPFAGWKVPDSERETWDRPLLRPEPKPVDDVKDIQTIVVELDAFVYLDEPLEHKIRIVYDHAPLKVTRLAAVVLEGIQSGRLNNPAGLLWKRLGEIER